MRVRPHEKLVAWQEAYKLCLQVYKLSSRLPSEEKFGLVSQMRRAASSVPLNLAEGNTKRSPKEKYRFFEIAIASLEEVHCIIRLCSDLDYCSENNAEQLDQNINRVSFLITKLQQSLNS